jgi:MFS family permease
MTETATRAASGPPNATSAERRPNVCARPGLLLAVLLTGQFMAIVDVSIVNVAIPTIRTDLHTSGATLQLIVAGYTIAYAVLLITGARLGDMAGYRRMFQTGLAVFTGASLACGLAWSAAPLVAFRCVQGAGAAMMIPQMLSLIQRNFTGAARARALGRYAAVIAGAVVVGQVLGGVLVTADVAGLGWRPIFLVNVPIGVVALVAGSRLLPADSGRRNSGLDPAGVLTLSPAVLLLVLPLVLGHQQDWPLWTWLSLAGSAALAGVFVLVERRVADRGGTPLVPGRVLRSPGMRPAIGGILLGMATYGGFLFTLALHLQGGLGDSPLRAGLTFVPGALSFAVVSLNWRRVPQQWQQRQIPIGYLVGAVGYIGLAEALRGGGHGGIGLAVSMVVFAGGLAAAFSPLLTVGLTHVRPADAADASGVLATMVQLGQVIGVATFGTLYLTLVTHPGAHPSAHAEAITAVAIAGAAVLAAACTVPLLRQAAGALQPRPDDRPALTDDRSVPAALATEG